ncbi:unnamed protein product [Soboliphyme baturini]|uniref:Uncharacterized protein n=1 Tax=Soboliphyme baturini TaxID=241478 RepID=A0A3P7Z8G2_9BILA|nr:unnamed protein product [Soboliphyme baturini]
MVLNVRICRRKPLTAQASRNRVTQGRESATQPFAIGTRFNVACSHIGGDAMNGDSNNIGLCNLCWSLRILPLQFFPRYINELSCNNNKTACLSGYGTCRPRLRNIDSAVIFAPVSCECYVGYGSVLYNLVTVIVVYSPLRSGTANDLNNKNRVFYLNNKS